MKMTKEKHIFCRSVFLFQVAMRGGEGRAAECGLTFLPSFLRDRAKTKTERSHEGTVASVPFLTRPC